MPIHHRDTCRRHPSRIREKVGRQGDLLLYCSDCGRLEVLREAEQRPAEHKPVHAAPRAPEVDTPAPAEPRSLYYCRDHYKPVTPKGTGCPECAAEQSERLKRKKKSCQTPQKTQS